MTLLNEADALYLGPELVDRVYVGAELVWPVPVVPAYEAAVLADSPVAYYRMQEPSGLVQDSSGNANHATFKTGTQVYDQAGPAGTGSAIRLSSGAGASYFRIPSAASLNVGDGPFTLEGWIKRDALGGYYVLLTKEYAGGYQFVISGDQFGLKSPGVAIRTRSVVTVPAGSWQHLVATKDGNKTDGTDVHLYLNGAAVTTAPVGYVFTNAASSLALGDEPGYGSSNFDLDEVAVYPTALSAARVLAHYEAAS